ncbi:MAG: hypothetical protein U0Y10_14245 [Spirosomataceae bacterium]
MRLKKLLVYLFLIGSASVAQAQLEQSTRIELTKDAKDDEELDVIPLQQNGVLVTLKKTDYFASSPFVWKFTKYDTQLKEQWKAEFKVGFGKNPLLSYHNKHYLYWLFGDPDSDDISIYKLDLVSGEVDEIEGEILAVEVVSHFRVLGNTAILAGKYHDKPVVALFSFFDKSTKVLPDLYSNHIDITDLEVDDDTQQVIVFSRTLTQKTGCQLAIRRYSYDGKLLFTSTFPKGDHTLLSGKLIHINESEYLLIGNYAPTCSSYSQGIYVTKVKGDETFPIKYIEFSELANFFNYMKPKRQQKIQEKIARKKEEGKEAHFRYMLMVHDFVKMPNDELVLVAESFYPQYKSPVNMVNPLMRSGDRNSESYRYTHALICGFDKNGNMRWDNSFPLKDLETERLSQQVQVTLQQNRLVLAYPKEGKINTQLISGSKVVKEKEEFEVKTTYENEKVLFAENASLSAWYDQYFLAWGFQKIESTKDKNTSQREVFYLNKLTYRPEEGPHKQEN